MNQKYTKPVLELININKEDIIITSTQSAEEAIFGGQGGHRIY